MKPIFLFLLLILSTGSYAKKLILATCTEGNGCTFQISEADATDYDIADGNNSGYYENLHENAIVVDVKINGKWEQYVETQMTRSQLDKFYGGDGFTMIYPFNPNFQPMNGEWQVKIGTVTGDICYGQESNMFKSILQGFNQSGNVKFPDPFHARFLMNNPSVKWKQIRPDLYKANFGNEYMGLKFDMQIISEKKIEGLFTVTIRVPTKEPCINKIPITYTCVKASEWKDPWEDLENEEPNVRRLEDDPKPNVPRLEN